MFSHLCAEENHMEFIILWLTSFQQLILCVIGIWLVRTLFKQICERDIPTKLQENKEKTYFVKIGGLFMDRKR